MKVAFFDRDGTIAQDFPDAEWSQIDTPVLMPYAIDALKHINNLGYRIIIITNQYLIGEGYITRDQYESYNKKLLSILKNNGIEILDVFYCPHKRSENCDCCKPKTGLIRMAVMKYSQIDFENSFVVGDSICDIQLAENLDMNAFGIGIDYNYTKNKKIKSLKELIKL